MFFSFFAWVHRFSSIWFLYILKRNEPFQEKIWIPFAFWVIPALQLLRGSLYLTLCLVPENGGLPKLFLPVTFLIFDGLPWNVNCSMMAWAAIPNASLAILWRSSLKSTNFWFDGFEMSFWKLCFALAIDWDLTYFLEKIVGFSRSFSRVGLPLFLNVCNASPPAPHEKLEIIDFVVFCQLVMILEACPKGIQTAQTSQIYR